MTAHHTTAARCRWLGCSVALVLLATFVGFCLADGPPKVVRVEEDWELIVGTPDPDTTSPQVTCVLSPLGHVESFHAAFELNQQSLPEFTPGGLQLQVWEGEIPHCERKFPGYGVLEQAGESVTWTQSVEISEGKLTFEITDGHSSTWGDFGGQGYLKSSIDTTLTSLDAYSPLISVSQSGVSYGANRVQSLVLKRIRVCFDTGEEFEDATARPVHCGD